MATTKDFGRLFFHTIWVRPETPLVHRAVTNEIEPPYRQSRSWVLRYARRKALVAGWWRHTDRDEDTALLDALAGRGDLAVLDDEAHILDAFERPPMALS